MDKELLKELKEIFKISDDVKLEEISLESYSEWDSFNIIQMLESFESNYELILELDDLRSFQTMKDVYNWAKKNRAFTEE